MHQAVLTDCMFCDADGFVESYPAYSAEAFDGCGNAISNEGPCPDCNGLTAVKLLYQNPRRKKKQCKSILS